MKTVHFIFLILFVFGCSDATKNERPGVGRLEGNTYTNRFFGITLKIPEGWVVQNKEQVKSLNEESRQIIQEKNPGVDMDTVQANSIEMLTVFQHEVSDTAEFNASFVLMAEKLPSHVPVMNEEVYLSLAANELLQSGFYTDVETTPVKIKIGGEDFYTIQASIMADEKTGANQEFFTRITDGYALLFILSYRTEAQYKELNEVLGTVKFD